MAWFVEGKWLLPSFRENDKTHASFWDHTQQVEHEEDVKPHSVSSGAQRSKNHQEHASPGDPRENTFRLSSSWCSWLLSFLDSETQHSRLPVFVWSSPRLYFYIRTPTMGLELIQCNHISANYSHTSYIATNSHLEAGDRFGSSGTLLDKMNIVWIQCTKPLSWSHQHCVCGFCLAD